MKLVVTGTGYVGLVTGTCLANIGHNVTCVDIDENKINLLKQGILPIYEEGLNELIKSNYDKKRLGFTTDYSLAYKEADVIFIGVGTPEREDGSANLDYIYEVAKQIADHIEKDVLIVIKSTVPIGTNDQIEVFIKSHLKHNVNIEIASNPEFLSQGTAVRDTMQATRIVIGVESKRAEDILREIYEPFNQPIVVTNRKSAEMIKYASNDFLALKISFINEIANLCEIIGADIGAVTKGMSYDPRIGEKFLNAGIGYGGSCFPKDTKALHWLAKYHDYELKTIKATIEVNENQKTKLTEKVLEYFNGDIRGKSIAVLGVTFKPETDDLREAPAIENVKKLISHGAKVVVYDPVGIEKFKSLGIQGIEYNTSIKGAIEKVDATIICTEWKEIIEFGIKGFKSNMKKPVLFDGRNCFSLQEAMESNIDYYSIGRKWIKEDKRR